MKYFIYFVFGSQKSDIFPNQNISDFRWKIVTKGIQPNQDHAIKLFGKLVAHIITTEENM